MTQVANSSQQRRIARGAVALRRARRSRGPWEAALFALLTLGGAGACDGRAAGGDPGVHANDGEATSEGDATSWGGDDVRPAVETACADGIDNDSDRWIDCDDRDCTESPACAEGACDDGIDGDGDGATDCEDTDCASSLSCFEYACGDREDNDGDGDIDGCDSDCGPSAPCFEFSCTDGRDNDGDGAVDGCDGDCGEEGRCAEGACEDGVDNDGDGAADCDDTDCCDRAFCGWCCEPGTEPACEPVPRSSIGDVDAPLAFVRSVRLPPTRDGWACSFDFTGDDVADNALFDLSELLRAYGVDLGELLTAGINAGRVAFVLEWFDAPSGEGFRVYASTNDLDGDGEPDQSAAARAAGDGVYRILDQGVDAYGALWQAAYGLAFERVSVRLVRAQPLPVSMSVGAYPTDVSLVAYGLFVEGAVERTETGHRSVDLVLDGGEGSGSGAAESIGGWVVAGMIPVDAIAAGLSAVARTCPCADYGPEPVLSYGDNGERYRLECVQRPDARCAESPHAFCRSLDALCDALPRALDVVDVDLNYNGVADALSFGVRASVVGATWAAPPLLLTEDPE